MWPEQELGLSDTCAAAALRTWLASSHRRFSDWGLWPLDPVSHPSLPVSTALKGNKEMLDRWSEFGVSDLRHYYVP